MAPLKEVIFCLIMIGKSYFNMKSVHNFKIFKSNEHESVELYEKLVHFNVKKVASTLGKAFDAKKDSCELAYVIKNIGRKIVGGIFGSNYFLNVVHIDVLFVHEPYRNKRFGTRLIMHFEGECKKIGVTLIHTDTFDWQAKDFYIKNGYEVFGVLEDCPKGHKRYYLKKDI
jgi:GNAT superfamily N-acetyltransferase